LLYTSYTIISGSANFLTEPIVQNVNNVNLKKLSRNLWMLNQDTVVSGINMNFTNITFAGDIIINVRKVNEKRNIIDLRKIIFKDLIIIPFQSSFVNFFSTEMWSNLSKRLLSRTKEQHIAVVSLFKNVEVPAIVAANNSRLRSTDSNLEDMLTNSLMKDKPQVVNAVWRFHELDISKEI